VEPKNTGGAPDCVGARGSEAETCEWKPQEWPDFDEYWDTSCDRAFTMMEGTPQDNDYYYCPGCGKKIELLAPPDEGGET